MLISSERAGSDNSLRITVEESDHLYDNFYREPDNTDGTGLSRLAYDPVKPVGQGANMVETASAQDAIINIDGIEITHPGNTIDDVIDNVALDIKKTTTEPIIIDVTEDNSSVVTSIQDFVAAYNTLQNVVTELTKYDPESETAAPLSGDFAVRSLVDQMRRRISSAYSDINTEFDSLASVGIRTQRDGTLMLDTAKLNTAINKDIDEVINLFSRVGMATDANIEFISGEPETGMGAFPVRITQLPTSGSYTGGSVGSFPIVIDKDNDAFRVEVDGITSEEITLSHRSYTNGGALAREIQNEINSDDSLKRNNAKVDVEYSNNRFVIRSRAIGDRSNVDIFSSEPGFSRDTGIGKGTGVRGTNVQGLINGQPATGIADVLTGTSGSIDGLKIKVTGDSPGDRGDVIYSRGVAEQLHSLLGNYLNPNGPIDTRLDGYNDRIKDLNEQRKDLAEKLAVSERRYLKQFSSLDALIGKMNATSDFLTNQLKTLPATNRKG